MSKKLLFLFIALITLNDMSYSSFPIADTLEVNQDTVQTEEIKQYHYRLQKMSIDLKSCKCESCRCGVIPLVSKPNILFKKKEIEIHKEKTEPNGNLFVFLSVISALVAIVFAFFSISEALTHNGNPFAYLILTLVSIGTSIICGIDAKKEDLKQVRLF